MVNVQSSRHSKPASAQSSTRASTVRRACAGRYILNHKPYPRQVPNMEYLGALEVLQLAFHDLLARLPVRGQLGLPQGAGPGGVHVAQHQPLHVLVELRRSRHGGFQGFHVQSSKATGAFRSHTGRQAGTRCRHCAGWERAHCSAPAEQHVTTLQHRGRRRQVVCVAVHSRDGNVSRAPCSAQPPGLPSAPARNPYTLTHRP